MGIVDNYRYYHRKPVIILFIFLLIDFPDNIFDVFLSKDAFFSKKSLISDIHCQILRFFPISIFKIL